MPREIGTRREFRGLARLPRHRHRDEQQCSAQSPLEAPVLEALVVRLDEVRKSGTESVIIGADQRVETHEVDVIFDDNEITCFVERIQTTGGI